jgi:hypothetical protein
MPGPVSQSYDPDPIRERWMQTMACQGFRYFVFKAKDVFAALSDDDLEMLDYLMKKIERHRESKGKPAARGFWVFARHWTGAEEVKELLIKLLGVAIGTPYDPSMLED